MPRENVNRLLSLLAVAGDRELRVRVGGQVTFNGTRQILAAAVDGYGLGYMPLDPAQPDIEAGRLDRVLENCCPPWSGYHLHHPSRQPSAAFPVMLDALCVRV